MIKQCTSDTVPLTLTGDLASEFPTYIYLSIDKQILLYSSSIIELLDDSRVTKPLDVSSEGLSFLLQSGVVPLPRTAYENVFILGVGDSVRIESNKGSLELIFKHSFPFFNSERLSEDTQPDQELILTMLADATISRLDQSKPIFLFHSAGKDSNPIAIALAQAGLQEQVTLVTHQGSANDDESQISKEIAHQLGFDHQMLKEVLDLEDRHKVLINHHYTNSPLPTTDQISLAYPLYLSQIPLLAGANIIDGSGSDVYMGHIPSKNEFRNQKLSAIFKYFLWIGDYTKSGSLFNKLFRSRPEYTGLFGLSYIESRKIYKDSQKVSGFWAKCDENVDYIDLRAMVRGSIIDTECFTRKVRNFSDAFQCNLILPWANKNIASYFSKLPEMYLFDRKSLKNKLILRKLLKDKLDLDSDALGKKAFMYDYIELARRNYSFLMEEVLQCRFWDLNETRKWLESVEKSLLKDDKHSLHSIFMVYRVYLISAWLNHCKYINPDQKKQ